MTFKFYKILQTLLHASHVLNNNFYKDACALRYSTSNLGIQHSARQDKLHVSLNEVILNNGKNPPSAPTQKLEI
jgi:hypothetical protein